MDSINIFTSKIVSYGRSSHPASKEKRTKVWYPDELQFKEVDEEGKHKEISSQPLRR